MSQPKFPNVEAMNLPMITPQQMAFGDNSRYIKAKDLERILESAPEVYLADDYTIVGKDWVSAKFTGRVIKTGEIKREPIKIEQTFSAKYGTDQMLIPRELTGKRFRVIFEELESEGK